MSFLTGFIRPLLVALVIVVSWNCEKQNENITDPAEMLERANSLLQDRAYAKAAGLFDQAITVLDRANNSSLLLSARIGGARTRLMLKQFRAAIAHLDAGIALSKSAGDFHAETELLLLRGDVDKMMFEFRSRGDKEAMESYEGALNLAGTFGDERSAAKADLSIAHILMAREEYSEAFEHYKNVAARYQALGDPVRQAEALLGISSIYRWQHKSVEALNSATQALGQIQRGNVPRGQATGGNEPRLAAQLYAAIGMLHEDQQNFSAAIADYRDAVNTLRRARADKDLEPMLLYRIGRLYERMKSLPEAKKYYTDAMEIAKSIGDKISEQYLAVIIVRMNLALMTSDQIRDAAGKIQQSYEQLAKNFQECGHAAGEAFCYEQLGLHFESIGNGERAHAMYNEAAQRLLGVSSDYGVPEIHRVFMEDLHTGRRYSTILDRLLHSCVELHRTQEALAVAEQRQRLWLNQLVGDAQISFRASELKPAMVAALEDQRWVRILEAELAARLAQRSLSTDDAELHALRKELESTRMRLKSESVSIAAKHVNYGHLLDAVQPDVGGIQKFIPRGSVVVQFVPTASTLYTLALTRGSLVVKSISLSRDSVLNLVRSYTQLLQDPSVYSGEATAVSVPALTRFASLSTQLYDLFIRPIEGLLEKNIIIVVGPGLEGFPFHAIERQEGGRVKYLVEMVSVDYVSSLTALKYRTTATSSIRSVVAFGNPTGKNWSVDYELRDIRSFFRSARVVTGIEASWDNLASLKVDVLQLSTEFLRGKGASSLGAFAISNGLNVEESAAVPFEKLAELEPSPVVILSNHVGEGMELGVAHALLLRANGTSDVFLNGWYADRRAAKLYSEYFYGQLANRLAPGDAYRQALLNLIKTRELNHPRSWAQYFHFGVG